MAVAHLRASIGVAVLALLASCAVAPMLARDDGRYAQSPLKGWFDSLKSAKGPCCSDADGFAVSDPDWENIDGRYRVRLKEVWYDVPDDAVITGPNRAGVAMVWPIWGSDGLTIRCFLAGPLA